MGWICYTNTLREHEEDGIGWVQRKLQEDYSDSCNLHFWSYKEEQELGTRPFHRPRNWQEEERRNKKKRKRNNWSSKGGCTAPIFVPVTPGGELAKELREIVEKESVSDMKYKIVESGGRTLKSKLQKSNPTATPGCENADWLACA